MATAQPAGESLNVETYIPAASSDRQVERQEETSRERERALVGAALQGDKEAFGALYEENHSRVFGLAQFYLGARDAEDAVAETFLRAWGALPRFKDRGVPFVGWLYGIARHVVADELKRRKRTHLVAEPPDAIAGFSHDESIALQAAMAKLPKEQRQVIEMKYLLGFKNPEVATAMSKSVGAVNALQWRALRSLNGMVER